VSPHTTSTTDAVRARAKRHAALDGFNLTPYLVPDGLDDIVDTLVPALQERGIYRREYTGSTLRAHLDLPLLTRRAGTADTSPARAG